MGLFGTLIGGGLGAMLGGPLGALLGASLGSMFGGKSSSGSNSGESTTELNQKQQLAFFTCYFSVLAKIAKADQQVTTDEIEAVNKIIEHKFKLDPATANIARKVFNNALKDPTDVKAYIQQFGEIVRFDKELCQVLINSMKDVSQADGVVSSGESSIIQDAMRILRLEVKQQNYNRQNYNQPSNNTNHEKLEQAYKDLECTSSMDDNEIKKVYRTKVSKFHPDKLQSKGLPEEFLDFAHNEMVKINDAYDTIVKARK